MKQYTVRSGQNIYDVALTLYGSVEGIFDLLASNKDVTLNSKLEYGQVLNYHDELMINEPIAKWLDSHNVLVKNGDHTFRFFDVEQFFTQHLEEEHPDVIENLSNKSFDEKNIFWEVLTTPKMIIRQQGQLCSFEIELKQGKHLIIDWGDYSDPEIIEDTNHQTVEHFFKGSGTHLITFYGEFECSYLDFTNVNGTYYPLTHVVADTFITTHPQQNLQTLIIQQ